MDGDRPSGVSIGTITWVKFALNLVGITTKNTSSLTAKQVVPILSANKPIMIFVKENKTVTTGHDLVLYSYTEMSSTNGQYVFMDPSKGSGALSVSIDSSVMKDGTNITLTCRSGSYYDYWQYSFYEG